MWGVGGWCGWVEGMGVRVWECGGWEDGVGGLRVWE